MESLKILSGRILAVVIVVTGVLSLPGMVFAKENRFCSQTARLLFRACRNAAQEDYLLAQAICVNESDESDETECNAEAGVERDESREVCREQLEGRQTACDALGEDRYDPDFDEENFDNPRNPSNPNPYFPLQVGNRWEYVGGSETISIAVLNQTKLIDDVTCIVVRDRVKDDGNVIEDTDDWFATAKDGNTWYCGEEVKNLESFEGDTPMRPELVSIDGSFKAGRAGDKPGIISLAAPMEGQIYREEFSLGNAEDIARVLSASYRFGEDAELDRLVPPVLAQRLCSAGDCVVTENISLLEPNVIERKYYAVGIGFFLETNPENGDIVQLVGCNFHSRCKNLPQP